METYRLQTCRSSDDRFTNWQITRSTESDYPELCRYYSRLSSTSLRLRFHHTISNIPTKFIRLYACPNQTPCTGLVLKSAAGEIAGEALVDLSSSSYQAELGVSVLDSLRGQGLGYELIARSIDIARRARFKQLAADTLRENRCFVKLMTRFGFEAARHPQDMTQIRLSYAL